MTLTGTTSEPVCIYNILSKSSTYWILGVALMFASVNKLWKLLGCLYLIQISTL